jgi:hypothetical protein
VGRSRTAQHRLFDCGYAEEAGAYDPPSGTWRSIEAGPLSGRVEHTAVWANGRMIVYGGSPPGGGNGREDGAVYDFASDSWQLLPDPWIDGRYRHAAVWTGEAMILWGGQTPTGQSFSDGASFHPSRSCGNSSARRRSPRGTRLRVRPNVRWSARRRARHPGPLCSARGEASHPPRLATPVRASLFHGAGAPRASRTHAEMVTKLNMSEKNTHVGIA